MLPQHMLHPQKDYLTIVHIASGCTSVGYAHLHDGKYHVQTDEDDDAGVVQSLSEIIPALLAYCEKHPARWQGDEATGYSKFTHFGDLRVERDQLGSWKVYRNYDCPLLCNGKPALFGTAEEAKRAADIHFADGLSEPKTISDGYSWDHNPLLEAWS
jgi:hypothetical protein